MSEREGPGAPGPSDHGDYHYDVVAHHRNGREHVLRYASEDPLEVGEVLRLEGRYWLIESIDGSRAVAQPARYCLILRHPDGREEIGAFRRFRPGSPRLGHTLATIEDGQAVNWQVVDQRVARDQDGEAYLELVAERDFSEVEELSGHETGPVVETMIPRRLDRLPWSRWHWLVVIGLGITWILDGFEVTLVGAIASMLTNPDALGLSTQQSASAGTFYLVGAITGALFFGYLTDRFGRKKLFTATLGVYLLFTVASGLAWNYESFVFFRFLAGAGIGGEYAAINSAIDELIPARVRGRVALAINGSWWVGTAFAAFFSYEFLQNLDESIGWRLGFFVGATLALGIIIIRRFIPESPRWLLTHGRAGEAERVVAVIEERVRSEKGELPEPQGAPIAIEQHARLSFLDISRYVIRNYPQRGLLGLSLMTGQAFLYNAIFFTYTLVLTEFYGVSEKTAPLYLIPFAVGNFVGPLVLGPLFDILGRRVMIPSTYIISGGLLILTSQLFVHDVLSENSMTVAWCLIFFFASAGASSAYLTVSELFPLEACAMAISLFYAIGTGLAALSPTLFGALIETASRTNVNYGYLLGAGLMIAAGIVAIFLAVPAERKALEDIASPYTAVRGRGPSQIAAPAQAS